MFDPASVKVRGPIAPYVPVYWKELRRQGYSPLAGRNLLRLAAHFSRWLEHRSLDVGDVAEEHVASYLEHRRRGGYTRFLTRRALEPLLGQLRGLGVTPAPSVIVTTSPGQRQVGQYAAYLARDRGLAVSTIVRYSDFAEYFIADVFKGAEPKWESLKPVDLTRFVLREAKRRSVGWCKHEITALRSWLRYLHVKGLTKNELVGAVPAVAGWRLASLPKALRPDQVGSLLRFQDPGSATGRRNAAIIRLRLRLGLRSGDVATLSLEDVDWRAGEIVLRGKGRREARLPLPRDVGSALAAYLRHDRPRTGSRRVFLLGRAPFTPLTSTGVSGAVIYTLRRAGIEGSAHLRHTAATQMLRHGASLSEIGHVLRHRHMDTTAIYAKVDLAALRAVAQPWPGAVQ